MSTASAVVKERTKPELITVGKRTVITNGRWNDDKMADHVLENGQDKWLPIAELAKVLGANTQANRKRVSKHATSLFKTFRERSLWLAVEYAGSHGSTTAFKVADFNSKVDRQAVLGQLERMKRRKLMTMEEYEKSVRLFYVMDVCGEKEPKQ